MPDGIRDGHLAATGVAADHPQPANRPAAGGECIAADLKDAPDQRHEHFMKAEASLSVE